MEDNYREVKKAEPCLKLIHMDQVEVEEIEWLFYPFIPYGKVTIIQGDILNGLEEKLDALVRHELYTKYKTAPSEEEQEKARQEYLDKRGVSASYRW